MLNDVVEILEKEPCLRLDFQNHLAENERIYSYFSKAFPTLMNGVERIMFDLPRGWVGLFISSFMIPMEEYKNVRIVQVKQKMGSLRIHIEGEVPQEAQHLVQMTEALSRCTCEWCGSTDDVSTLNDGYISRSCRNCRSKICNYTIAHWVLAGNTEELNEAQKGLLRELRKIRNDEISGTTE